MAHPDSKPGRNRYYGIILTSAVQGGAWEAVLIRPDRSLLAITDDSSWDLFAQRGDAVTVHLYPDKPLETVGLPDDVVMVAKGAVVLP